MLLGQKLRQNRRLWAQTAYEIMWLQSFLDKLDIPRSKMCLDHTCTKSIESRDGT